MLGTRQMAGLTHHVLSSGGKLVLVGDHPVSCLNSRPEVRSARSPETRARSDLPRTGGRSKDGSVSLSTTYELVEPKPRSSCTRRTTGSRPSRRPKQRGSGSWRTGGPKVHTTIP